MNQEQRTYILGIHRLLHKYGFNTIAGIGKDNSVIVRRWEEEPIVLYSLQEAQDLADSLELLWQERIERDNAYIDTLLKEVMQ